MGTIRLRCTETKVTMYRQHLEPEGAVFGPEGSDVFSKGDEVRPS